ncbi:MAG: DNA repair protein RadA [Gammaproteobacteria bacterium]|nr:MAG: DNA repair protein RadA [Gammaproteobacteria bacterium]
MARSREEQYVCTQCGSTASKWSGRCADCGEWNSYEVFRTTPGTKKSPRVSSSGRSAKVRNLSEVELGTIPRISSGIEEMDRVLGGGIVPGSVILIGGDPGIGKSTILLQVLSATSATHRVLYVTGEESLQQVGMRAVRLGLSGDSLPALAETRVDTILTAATQTRPEIMVVDSIQTVFSENLDSAPGSVSQVRESAARLVDYAKHEGVAMILVGHVTKEGALAGPRVLEHMVDTVLYFEGDSNSRYRMIRATKNRFGAVNELGLFAMTETGLKEVTNPSAIFLANRHEKTPGNVIVPLLEGTRPILAEIQALTVEANQGGGSRRVAVGLELNRLTMLLAVLQRHGGVQAVGLDIFINVVGGLKISETSADLAVLMAIVSSLNNRVIPYDWVIFGELGLSGEIRPVRNGLERLQEAVKHGVRQAILPKANAPRKPLDDLIVHPVSHLSQVLEILQNQ